MSKTKRTTISIPAASGIPALAKEYSAMLSKELGVPVSQHVAIRIALDKSIKHDIVVSSAKKHGFDLPGKTVRT